MSEKLTKAQPIVKKNGGTRGVGMTDDEIDQATAEMIARHVVQLSEHVSSIQIICTKVRPDGTTRHFAYGSGDIYARAKAAEVFLNCVQG